MQTIKVQAHPNLNGQSYPEPFLSLKCPYFKTIIFKIIAVAALNLPTKQQSLFSRIYDALDPIGYDVQLQSSKLNDKNFFATCKFENFFSVIWLVKPCSDIFFTFANGNFSIPFLTGQINQCGHPNISYTSTAVCTQSAHTQLSRVSTLH